MAKPRRSPAKLKSVKSMTRKKMSSSSSAKSKSGGTTRATPRRPAAGAKSKAKPVRKPKAKASARAKVAGPVKSTRMAGKAQAVPPARFSARPKPSPPPPPAHRSTYADAVAAYDRGMQAFHARKFDEAGTILSSIVTLYPEEKELHERVQMYLNVCARHAAPRLALPATVEERVNSATLAINNGRPDEAIDLLKGVVAEDASNDAAIYLLGVAQAIKHDFPAAMSHLERAIRLNPENRDLIRKDVDLELLRQTDEFETLLTTPASSGRRRKT